jgi:hypothetical protein
VGGDTGSIPTTTVVGGDTGSIPTTTVVGGDTGSIPTTTVPQGALPETGGSTGEILVLGVAALAAGLSVVISTGQPRKR